MAKFSNDSNFFVHEVGQGSGALERSLEIAEVSRESATSFWQRACIDTEAFSSQQALSSAAFIIFLFYLLPFL